jgi:hypothetical protein
MEDPQRKYVLKELCDPVKEIVDLKGSSLFKHSRNGTLHLWVHFIAKAREE